MIVVRVDPDIEDLIPGFLKNRRADVDAIREALDRDDYAAVQSFGHKMKGQGGSYGFDVITEIGAGIELAAKSKDGEAIRGKLPELAAYLAEVKVVSGEEEDAAGGEGI